MPGYGWSYLVVTRTEEPAGAAPRFEVSDGSTFDAEDRMLGELGVTGWELVAIRQAGARVVFYFKRPRA
ncbi:MAG TPA: hypothetical protein VGD37_35940 [Kofleriaceae bacterium]|jgi:hypothetical protein